YTLNINYKPFILDTKNLRGRGRGRGSASTEGRGERGRGSASTEGRGGRVEGSDLRRSKCVFEKGKATAIDNDDDDIEFDDDELSNQQSQKSPFQQSTKQSSSQ